ncbi:MAG: lyase [Chloroflexota bacterium]
MKQYNVMRALAAICLIGVWWCATACAAVATPTAQPVAPSATPPPTEPTAKVPAQRGTTDTPPATATRVSVVSPPAGDTFALTPTTVPAISASPSPERVSLQEYAVPRGARPHDVAPAADGGVWYTAQGAGALGWLDPRTGETRQFPLGNGSAPHGVIVGPDGAPWITDGGLNAIVRVDPASHAVQRFPLPSNRNANLNTATFDQQGALWFTGQSGVYGRLDPPSGKVEVFDAPRGAGPYGIATTPSGDVYYASLAGSHIARIDLARRSATPIDPPTAQQGARRVWPDSRGRLWVSEWNAGQVALYDPATNRWREWRLPGPQPQAYAVYVDERDRVWLTDFGANALVRFDPSRETFAVFNLPSASASVRQLLGRAGEVWGAESGADKLVVARTSR